MPPNENVAWLALTRDVFEKWLTVAKQLSLSDSAVAELLIASYENATETSSRCRCCGSSLPNLCSACLRQQQQQQNGAEGVEGAQREARWGEPNHHAAQAQQGHQHPRKGHYPDVMNDQAEVQIKIESVSSLKNVSQEQPVKLEDFYHDDEEADHGSVQLQEMERKNEESFLQDCDIFNEEDYETADVDNNLEYLESDSDQNDIGLGVTFMSRNKRKRQLCRKQDTIKEWDQSLMSEPSHPKETGSPPNKRDKLNSPKDFIKVDTEQAQFDPKTVCVVLKRCDSLLANSEHYYSSVTDSKKDKQITQKKANKICSGTTTRISSVQKSTRFVLAKCLPSASENNKLMKSEIVSNSSTGTEPTMVTEGTKENMVDSKTDSDFPSDINSNVTEESMSAKLTGEDSNGIPLVSGCYEFEEGSGISENADLALKTVRVKLNSCSICDKAFSKPSKLLRHLFQAHKTEGRKCDLCKQVVLSSHLRDHRKNCPGLVDDAAEKGCSSNMSGTNSYLNESDHKKQDAEGSATIDIDNINSEKSLISTDNVDENEPEEHNILSNQMKHQEKKHVCEMCDKKFRYPCEYSLHKKRAHMGKPYQCSKCDKSFTLPHYLQDHENVHSGIKPYKCPDCEINFHTKMELQVHKPVHRKRDSGISENADAALKTMLIKLNSCSICDKAFVKPSKLQRHLFQVHKTQGHKCDLCKKVVISSHLKEHRKMFHGFVDDAAETYCTSNMSGTSSYLNESDYEGRALVCDRCGKNFDRTDSLKSHKCLHDLKLGQFICERCNNSFQTKDQLEVHSSACFKSSEISNEDANLEEQKSDLCDEIIISSLLYEHKNCVLKTETYSNIKNNQSKDSLKTFCNPSVNIKEHEEKQILIASTKDNNYKCGVCVEAFSCLLLLKQHNEHAHLLGIATTDKSCMCDECLETGKNQEKQVLDAEVSGSMEHVCDICEEKLASLEKLKEHKQDIHGAAVLTETEEKKHNCKACNLQFSCLFDYKMHVSQKHLTSAYRCAQCSKIFLSARSLKDHENVHTGSKPYKCKICGEDFHKQYTLSRHKSEKHKETLEKCAMNADSTKSSTEMVGYCSLHARCFQCQLCNKCYSADSQLKIHIAACHEVKKFSCEFCGKLFGRIESLRKHRSVHSDLKPFVCETCHKTFKTKYLLRSHAVSHAATRRHICEFCGLSTNSSGDLKKHIRIHTDEKPYACNECPQRFRRQSKLNEHKKRKHSARVKSIFCTLCTSSFYSNYGLKSHMQRVHATGTRRHSCPVCQKLFFTKAELNSHMNTHLYKKERAVARSNIKKPEIYCEQCLKTFSSRSNLLVHVSVHSAVKQFKCSMCPKAFKQYCSLSKHIICHSGNPKPYVCDICQKGFPQKGMLKFHKLKHSGQKPSSVSSSSLS